MFLPTVSLLPLIKMKWKYRVTLKCFQEKQWFKEQLTEIFILACLST